MPLYRPRYLVELDPATEPEVVTVTSGDMMRAELEYKRLRYPDGLNFTTTALWLWAALVRTGREERKAGEFLADPPEWAPVKDAAGELELAQVDPTMPGSGETDSDAPQSMVTQVSG